MRSSPIFFEFSKIILCDRENVYNICKDEKWDILRIYMIILIFKRWKVKLQKLISLKFSYIKIHKTFSYVEIN